MVGANIPVALQDRTVSGLPAPGDLESGDILLVDVVYGEYFVLALS